MNKENVADDRFISQCKKKSSVREYSDSISIDLFIDIFSRVPAKSIARFRCVSKFWEYILRRPDFTELFLTKSFTRPRFLLSFNVNGQLFFFSAPQPQNPDENSSLVATCYKYFPKYFPTGISPPVRGLVLLRSRTRGKKPQVICNPVTGESITLQKVKGTGIKRSYLGFDPISKEFKVLCMTLSRSRIAHTHRVLTLETGKRLWRTIQDPIFPHFPAVGEICIDGVLYYQAHFEGSYVIVCFDIRSEKFGFVKLDEDMLHGNVWNLFNYKGKLGAHGYVNWSKGEFVLWVLEDAIEHKWSKIICVLPPFWYEIVDKHYNVVGITCTGDIVFTPCYLSNPFYHIYYNVERNIFTRVNIQGIEEFKHKYHRILVSTFLDYVENMKFM